jgi:hypothetical protein
MANTGRGNKSEKTQIVLDYLEDCFRQNKTALFTDMSALTGVDVITDGRSYVSSAINSLKRHKGMFFQNIHGVGYQPVPQSITPGWVNETRMRQVRRKAEMHKRDLNQVVVTVTMSREQMHQLEIGRVLNAHLMEITDERTLSAICQTTQNGRKEIMLRLPSPDDLDTQGLG